LIFAPEIIVFFLLILSIGMFFKNPAIGIFLLFITFILFGIVN
jgi:hypothetical protein